jgi:hypothetical protein
MKTYKDMFSDILEGNKIFELKQFSKSLRKLLKQNGFNPVRRHKTAIRGNTPVSDEGFEINTNRMGEYLYITWEVRQNLIDRGVDGPIVKKNINDISSVLTKNNYFHTIKGNTINISFEKDEDKLS